MNRKLSTIFSYLLAAAICTGCNVDDSYDLSNIKNDGVGLGTDETEFYMPLLSVNIDPSQPLTTPGIDKSVTSIALTKGDDGAIAGDSSVDIFGNLESINAILPGRTIDLTLVASDDNYLNELIDDLMFEINEDEEKSKSFCDAIIQQEDYADLKDQIQAPASSNGLDVDLTTDRNPDYYLDLQAALPASSDDQLYSKTSVLKTKKITFDIIRDLVIANTVEQIEAGIVDIGSGSFSLLNDNLDGDKNTLHLFASFETDLDVEIELTVTINYSGENKLKIPAYLKGETPSGGSEQINGELLEAILANLQFEVSFGIKDYDPTKKIDTTGKYIKLTFIALKKGSIKF